MRSLTIQALQLPRDCIPSWCRQQHGSPAEAISRWVEACTVSRQEVRGRGGKMCMRDRQTLDLIGSHNPFLGHIPKDLRNYWAV